MQGWRVFHEKQCAACHAIWDQGGRVGPDLGRIRSGRLSTGQLAGIMWNHIPKMLARMKQAGYPPATLSASEMADIFALVYFVRQLDELGNPVTGERVLRDKGCAECHTINMPEGSVGPDLAEWGGYANPIIWAQMMWQHAPMMAAAMERSGMNWPKLEGDDLDHIVAYVRSAGISGEKTYLRPGSVTDGRRLFLEKKCDSCHPGRGPDLREADLPTSVGSLAASMWNHSPAMTRVMREQDVARQEITPQELADVLAYVLSLGQQDIGGDPARGERIFAGKGCAQCHEAGEAVAAGQSTGPALQDMGKRASPVNVATAMWNHGETMLDEMTEVGMSWPVFVDNEMVDLLAYLKAEGSRSGNDESTAAQDADE
ncbi:MAG: c-type cytochrome [bacterium]|nr:c-type cytochrome [bacterium]